MPGFIFSSNKDCSLYSDFRQFMSKDFSSKRYFLQQYTNNKFCNDKLTYSSDDLTYIVEGVIFNYEELIEKYNLKSRNELMSYMYKHNGEAFFSEFRGSFSGMVYDENNDKGIFFTNHIGDKSIFYALNESDIYIGSEIKFIVDLLKQNNINISLNETAAHYQLTYGHMLEDITYVKEIQRLLPGYYITFENGECKVKQYHQFKYKPDEKMTEDQVIERIDELFLRAVKRQVDKNDEYGYQNLSALSAGLDSRMTTYAIHRLKGVNFNTFTYSPIGFYDQIVSAKISKQLSNSHYIYHATNSGELLKDIDGSVFQNEGLYMYYGVTVLKDYFSLVEKNNIGIIHSGQIAAILCGAYLNKYAYKEFSYLYNRGFLGIHSGSNMVFQQFGETSSPFCDVDFAEFCCTIPSDLRSNHYIYDKWILKKYPNAAKFRHNEFRRIGKPTTNKFFYYIYAIKRKIKKMFISEPVTSVTPLNIWSNRADVSKYLDDYFTDHILLLDNYKELKIKCIEMYDKGSALEKNMVLTLLASYKLLLT